MNLVPILSLRKLQSPNWSEGEHMQDSEMTRVSIEIDFFAKWIRFGEEELPLATTGSNSKHANNPQEHNSLNRSAVDAVQTLHATCMTRSNGSAPGPLVPPRLNRSLPPVNPDEQRK